MIELVIWVITPDTEMAGRWAGLFSRERFQARQLAGLAAFKPAPGNWGLAFIEIGTAGLAEPKDLKAFLGGRKDISVIVFSRPGRTGNALISGFLENGADDFITTDINENVLLSKTKAHIRRLLPSLNAARTIIFSKNREVEIDRLQRTARLRPGSGHEKLIETLRPKEFDIFFLLLSQEEEVVSRNFLMEEIWRTKAGDVNCETIDKHVETLRRKLGPYGRNIRTVYGAGYMYKARQKER